MKPYDFTGSDPIGGEILYRRNISRTNPHMIQLTGEFEFIAQPFIPERRLGYANGPHGQVFLAAVFQQFIRGHPRQPIKVAGNSLTYFLDHGFGLPVSAT